MMNGLQTLTQWQNCEFSPVPNGRCWTTRQKANGVLMIAFHSPSSSQLGLLNCIMSVGSLVALPTVPYIADILGRRTGVFIGCSIMVLGVTLQSIGTSFGIFVCGRFFIGFGVGKLLCLPCSQKVPVLILSSYRPWCFSSITDGAGTSSTSCNLHDDLQL